MKDAGPYGWSALFFFFGDENSPPTGIRTPLRPATSVVALRTGAENIRNAGVYGPVTLKQILEQ
jgi:hypothetical protein